LAGSDAYQCLQTVHVRDHAPDVVFAEPHEVFTIRLHLPNILSVAYWVEDAFVTQPMQPMTSSTAAVTLKEAAVSMSLLSGYI
jgi:hypothetical protein